MGAQTSISWCDHTFSPWWGCVEVSPACDHCYARELARSPLHRQAVWGHGAPRRFFSNAHWREPLAWNRQAERAGTRHRVFCASMADVLEQRTDDVGRRMDAERDRLWRLIAATPWLDWLLLTKRPQFYRRVPHDILAGPNVWPGTTVERADFLWRADELLRLDCAGPRWVSYEPALGPLDLHDALGPDRLAWIVVGGESGPTRRPMDLAWLEGIAEQCQCAGAALYVKQDSAFKAGAQGRIPDALWARKENPRSHVIRTPVLA
jgi:protein gp37